MACREWWWRYLSIISYVYSEMKVSSLCCCAQGKVVGIGFTHKYTKKNLCEPHRLRILFFPSFNIIIHGASLQQVLSNRMSMRLYACCASRRRDGRTIGMRWLLRSMIVMMMIMMVVVAERRWWNRPSELLVFISWEIYVRSLASNEPEEKKMKRLGTILRDICLPIPIQYRYM